MPRLTSARTALAAFVPALLAPTLALANPVVQRFPVEGGTGSVQLPLSTKQDTHLVQLLGTGIRVMHVEPSGCPTVEAVFPGDGKEVPSLSSPGAGNARVYFLAIRGGVPGVSFLATDKDAPNGLRLLQTLAFDQPIGAIYARPDGADFVDRYFDGTFTTRLFRVDGDAPVEVPDSDAQGSARILVGDTIYFTNKGPLRKLSGDTVTDAADGDPVDRLIAGCGSRLYYAKAAIPSSSQPAELWALDAAGNRSLGIGPPALATACMGEKLLFGFSEPATGYEQWISDGSAAGTKLLLDLAPGTASGSPKRWAATPDGLSAIIQSDDGLFRTDGTTAGTTAITDVDGLLAIPGGPTLLGGESGAFFLRSGSKLGKLGTSGPLSVFGDAGTAAFSLAPSFHAGRYFAKRESGRELWSFDPATPADGVVLEECAYPAIVTGPAGGTGGTGGAAGAGSGGADQGGAAGDAGAAGAGTAGDAGAAGAGAAGKAGGSGTGGKGGAAGKGGSAAAGTGGGSGKGGSGVAGASSGKAGSTSGSAGRGASAGNANAAGAGGAAVAAAPAAAADDGGCSVAAHDGGGSRWLTAVAGLFALLAGRRRKRARLERSAGATSR